MNIRQTLLNTDISRFRPASVRGEEPVRAWRRTAALLRSRLNMVNAGEADFLAEPRFDSDHNIEWSTDRFESVPRPLSELSGAERLHYEKILGKLTGRLRQAAKGADAETKPLLEAIATVPGEDCIFCADDKVVIAQWAMKPNDASVSSLNLLAYRPDVKDDVQAAQIPPKVVATGAAAAEAVVPPATPPAAAPVPPVTPPVQPPVTPVVPPVVPADKPRRRDWKKWLFGLLLALLLILLLWWLFRSCDRQGDDSTETVENIEKVPPPLEKEKVIPAPDSLSYIAGDRINIYVLKGGNLDDFIDRFRNEKQWQDRTKYQLVNPDTTLRRVILICPEDEREKMMEEVPQRMKPDLEVVALYENIYVNNARTNDPAMSNQAQSYYFDMTGAIDAWDREMGDADVTIAVLDGGFDLSHPELKGKIVKPYDAVGQSSQVPNVLACQGHATHVSSTAAGNANNGQGAAGIAPGCKIMPINVFTMDGQSYDSAIIDGIMYAVTQGADVINMSLGAAWGPMMKLLPPEELERLGRERQVQEAEIWDKVFDFAESRGVTIVKAAGNDNIPASLDPMNRSAHALVVSAVDPSGRKAIFDPFTRDGSNYGRLCRISAPGVDIYNAIPGGKYASLPGTSMASPQVAGGAALLKSRHPDWTPETIRKVLIGTARRAGSADVGPVMYLAAALDADPDNLPPSESVPDYSAGTGGGFNSLPDPFEDGGEGYYEVIIGNPGSPGNGTGEGTRNVGDCTGMRRKYEDLKRRKAEIEREMEALRRDCPECI